MSHQRCMIQVSGTTYRIQAQRDHARVFRVVDDRFVGTFQHRPSLRVIETDVAHEQMLEIARTALRAARLPWSDRVLTPRASTASPAGAVWARRKRPARTLASLLVLLWPSA